MPIIPKTGSTLGSKSNILDNVIKQLRKNDRIAKAQKAFEDRMAMRYPSELKEAIEPYRPAELRTPMHEFTHPLVRGGRQLKDMDGGFAGGVRYREIPGGFEFDEVKIDGFDPMDYYKR